MSKLDFFTTTANGFKPLKLSIWLGSIDMGFIDISDSVNSKLYVRWCGSLIWFVICWAYYTQLAHKIFASKKVLFSMIYENSLYQSTILPHLYLFCCFRATHYVIVYSRFLIKARGVFRTQSNIYDGAFGEIS